MLLALKGDNTTGSLCLCHLVYVLSMIIISGYICPRVHLYTITICTDGMIMIYFYFYNWVLFAWGVIGQFYYIIDMCLYEYCVNTGWRHGGQMDSMWNSEYTHHRFESHCCQLVDHVTSLGKM